MSIFTYHLVRTSYIAALRAVIFPLKPKQIWRLIHAECVTTMVLGSPVFSFSGLGGREVAVFAQWDNEEDIDLPLII